MPEDKPMANSPVNAEIQSVPIHVGEDTPDASTIYRRRDDAGDPLQAIAQVEVGHVVEARLIEYRTAHAQQR